MEYIVAGFKAWMQKIRVFVSRISPPLEQRNVFNFLCVHVGGLHVFKEI